MSKRKLVQIVPATGAASKHDNIALYALDNYGQLWCLRTKFDAKDDCVWNQWWDMEMPWEQQEDIGPVFNEEHGYTDLNWLDTKIKPKD